METGNNNSSLYSIPSGATKQQRCDLGDWLPQHINTVDRSEHISDLPQVGKYYREIRL